MFWFCVYLVFLVTFCYWDVSLYMKSKWPERARFWWVPGAGYYCYWKFGPNE
jgi:hypothetical protein